MYRYVHGLSLYTGTVVEESYRTIVKLHYIGHPENKDFSIQYIRVKLVFPGVRYNGSWFRMVAHAPYLVTR